MKVLYYPSDGVKEFGERLASALMDADIRRSMQQLGGCKAFDIADFEPEMRPYITAYLEGNHDSVAILYAAMRAKEVEKGL